MSDLNDYLKAELITFDRKADDGNSEIDAPAIVEITERGEEVEIAFDLDLPKLRRVYLRFNTAELLAAIPAKKRNKP